MRSVPALLLALLVVTLAPAGAAADPLPVGPAPGPPLPNDIQPPVAGTMATGAAFGVDSTTAGVAGVVRPYDRPTTIQWEYGTTIGYGQHTQPISWPAATTGESAGLGGTLTGLTPLTTYHFRITVTSDLGTFAGDDLTFTTTPEAPVRGSTGSLVQISRAGAYLTVYCTGQADNSCIGTVRVSAPQTLRRHHRRIRRMVLVGTGRFSFSTGPITGPGAVTADVIRNSTQVTLSLTTTGRKLIARHRHLWGTVALSIQRGQPWRHQVLLRPEVARAGGWKENHPLIAPPG